MPRAVDSAVVTCPYETCGVDVRVLRADTRAPVDRADVLLVERNERKTLGAAGAVSFERLPAGSYTARVTSADIGREIAGNLPRSGTARVAAGGLVTIEILVELQEWELTTVVISGADEPGGGGSGDPPPPDDWEITTVVVAGDAVDEGGNGDAPPAAPEPDWELTTIEISGEASGGDGGGDEAPAAPPPNATWQLGEIQIGDDDD